MIEHLRGRDRKLELHGWTGREAEWIALHSGVFTRTQFCHYFDTHRVRAFRFVKMLLARKQAVETAWPTLNNGGKTCRISSKAIYRALGVENIRHRRTASDLVVMLPMRLPSTSNRFQKYSQHQAIGGRLRFWNRSFKASCSSPWTVFLSWAASTRSCW